MDWDDARPRPKPTVTVGEPIAALAVDDLKARIEALEAEIARTRQELAAKQAHQQAADTLFKR